MHSNDAIFEPLLLIILLRFLSSLGFGLLVLLYMYLQVHNLSSQLLLQIKSKVFLHSIPISSYKWSIPIRAPPGMKSRNFVRKKFQTKLRLETYSIRIVEMFFLKLGSIIVICSESLGEDFIKKDYCRTKLMKQIGNCVPITISPIMIIKGNDCLVLIRECVKFSKCYYDLFLFVP